MGKPRENERAVVLINGERLRSGRAARGVTQSKLGQAVGVSGAMISLLEKGERAASRTLAVDLAEALGLSLESLAVERPTARPSRVADTLVGTTLIAVVDNEPGILHLLAERIAAEDLNIRSLSVSADRSKIGTVTFVLDPIIGGARERVRKAVEAMQGVHKCTLANLQKPVEAASTVMPITPGGHSAGGLRLVAVGLPDSPTRITLMVWARDRVGLMRDLARIVAVDFHHNIIAAGSSADADSAFMWFMIPRPGEDILRRLAGRMRRVKDVQEVLISTAMSPQTKRRAV